MLSRARSTRSLTSAHPRDRNTDPRPAAVPRPATRAEKVARLKLAKAEAERDIEAYKATREAQFQVFSKERMGDTGSYSKGLAKATEEELAAIAKAVIDNKASVIDLLLKSVKTVSAYSSHLERSRSDIASQVKSIQSIGCRIVSRYGCLFGGLRR